nr:hypothetical protein [uncultured Rhodoferax sp.]
MAVRPQGDDLVGGWLTGETGIDIDDMRKRVLQKTSRRCKAASNQA